MRPDRQLVFPGLQPKISVVYIRVEYADGQVQEVRAPGAYDLEFAVEPRKNQSFPAALVLDGTEFVPSADVRLSCRLHTSRAPSLVARMQRGTELRLPAPGQYADRWLAILWQRHGYAETGCALHLSARYDPGHPGSLLAAAERAFRPWLSAMMDDPRASWRIELSPER